MNDETHRLLVDTVIGNRRIRLYNLEHDSSGNGGDESMK
jgi:hypothetical protein